MPSKTTSFYLATATCFGLYDHQRAINTIFKKSGKNATHIYSPFCFRSVRFQNFKCLLLCEIVNTDRTLPEGCQITVDLGKMYHDNIKTFDCKINY